MAKAGRAKRLEAPTIAAPDPFLEVRVKRLDLTPGLIGLCAGYEQGRWRSRELAEHMLEWLPEFALNYTEAKSVQSGNAARLLKEAALRVYQTDKFQNRGEFGELLLHIVLRQVFRTVPAISKIYYKDSANHTVKGFDAVHVVADTAGLQLWLGESKFYEDISSAINDVVAELERHSEDRYLRGEFATIINKIDDAWPHADRLRKLLNPNTSLDDVFDALCVPVLLTYNSKAVNAHSRVTEAYCEAFRTELERHHVTFSDKSLPKVQIYLFLIPLKSKKDLVKELDEELRRWQKR
jgi:hypothetical protein